MNIERGRIEIKITCKDYSKYDNGVALYGENTNI